MADRQLPSNADLKEAGYVGFNEDVGDGGEDEEELSELEAAGYRGFDAAPAEGKIGAAPAEDKAATVKAKKKWALKMPPDEYLERYPDGQHADEARAILEAEEEE